MTKFYTGIGSRKTPIDVLKYMKDIAGKLSDIGYILRSGGADGADTAFEEGVGYQMKEIYLPWSNFNNRKTGYYTISDKAYHLAAKYHPYWDKCNDIVKKLMARNCYQVLGYDLETPSKFVLCWTPDGAETSTTRYTGGTGQAIRIANAYGIPVFNLYNETAKHIINNILYMENKNVS